jgi:glutaredoxin 3
MAKVEIYTTPFCGFCLRAKQYLKKQGIEFTEFDVSANPEMRREMTERSGGGQTVPQIFINDQSIGGCDDLFELAMDGELDDLLA